jgi:solute carrier family 25 carnitine/acylcarnitine transporter 20/29
MSSPLAGVAAINAITFGVYGNVLRRMEDPTSVTSVMTAGAAAGLIQVSQGHNNIIHDEFIKEYII